MYVRYRLIMNSLKKMRKTIKKKDLQINETVLFLPKKESRVFKRMRYKKNMLLIWVSVFLIYDILSLRLFLCKTYGNFVSSMELGILVGTVLVLHGCGWAWSEDSLVRGDPCTEKDYDTSPLLRKAVLSVVVAIFGTVDT